MTFAAQAQVTQLMLTQSAQLESVEKQLLTSALRRSLNIKKLTADNFTNIDLALKEIKRGSQDKSASAISADMAALIRSYSNLDDFLTGYIQESLLPVELPKRTLSKIETRVFKVMARTIIYPESVYLLTFVKKLNRELKRNISLINHKEQQRAQKKCFERKTLTLNCLLKNALDTKITQILNSIEMSEKDDFEHDEIKEAIVELISKASHTKTIVAKRLFYYEGAEHILKNHSQLDLFAICVGFEKGFRYWQMESMTHCRSVWKKELGSVEMDPELEAVFFRQVTKFDAVVMRLVQGLSREILAPKMSCSKKDKACVESELVKRLSQWSRSESFTSEQIEGFSKSLARNMII